MSVDCDAVGWRAIEDEVQRLCQRSFTDLLEPCASMRCSHGSEGGGAQQCVPPTRPMCAAVLICRGGPVTQSLRVFRSSRRAV